MAAKQRNRFIDFILYIGLRLVNMSIQCFPVDTNLGTAKFLGDIMYLVDRRHRERALANLRNGFPDMPERQRRNMARRSMQQLFMLFVEVLFTVRLVRLDTWSKYLHLHNFQDALGLFIRHKGLIIVSAHYGNWEILAYLTATLGFTTTSVARPLDNPYVNRWLLGVRERRGQRIIDKKGATTMVAPLLESGGSVGFIADQNAGTKGIFVDFFGRKASTYKSIGLLAMQFEVPVVVAYARRRRGRFEFDVAVQDVIYPADWKGQDDPLRYITQRYTKGIEDFVRADPGQYLWIHRRWKTRPKGEEAEKYD